MVLCFVDGSHTIPLKNVPPPALKKKKQKQHGQMIWAAVYCCCALDAACGSWPILPCH